MTRIYADPDREIKNLDEFTSLTFFNTDTLPADNSSYHRIVQTVNAVQQGPEAFSRTGKRITVRGLELRATIILPEHDLGADEEAWDRVRLLVVEDNQCNNAPYTIDKLIVKLLSIPPPAQDIFNTLSMYSVPGMERFKIWSDKTYELASSYSSLFAGGLNVSNATFSHLHDSFNIETQILFAKDDYDEMDPATRIEMISCNNLSIVVLSETKESFVDLNYRLLYTDD